MCHLKKSIYGLKQSSRQWYLKFLEAILEANMNMIEDDHCVYVKKIGEGLMILSLYVDDILHARSNMVWSMPWKDGYPPFLKWRIWVKQTIRFKIIGKRSKRILGLSQENYIKKILKKFCIHQSKPIDTPVKKSQYWSLDQCLEKKE